MAPVPACRGRVHGDDDRGDEGEEGAGADCSQHERKVCAKARVMSGVHGSAPVLERFGEVSLARIARRRDGEGQ